MLLKFAVATTVVASTTAAPHPPCTGASAGIPKLECEAWQDIVTATKMADNDLPATSAFNKINQYLRDSIQEGVDDPELKEGRLKFATVVPNPKIGREDATGPSPDTVPPLADAPDADVLAAFERAGIRKGYIAPLAFALGDRDAVEKKWAGSSDDQLAYYAKKVQVNRSASLQTNYQIDLANAFVALSYLGLKDPTGPNYQRYLYPRIVWK